jgi:hypothetical protein
VKSHSLRAEITTAVQRSVATTSIASKKPDPVEDEKLETDIATKKESSSEPASAIIISERPVVTHDDWDDDNAAEKAALQDLVDRLQDKGDREVARVLKVCNTELNLELS